VFSRYAGNGCPFCSNRRVSVDNNLQARHPEVAKLWHPRKNLGKKPTDVLPGSKQIVWWQCPRVKKHVWRSRVSERVLRPGCPQCGRVKARPREAREGNAVSYTGVRFDREAGLYIASIKHRGRRLLLGGWKRARDAAKARDRAALYLGASVKLHFPQPSRKLGPSSPKQLRELARQDQERRRTTNNYRGVTRRRTGTWSAQLNANNVTYILNGYRSEQEAAIAFDRLVLRYGTQPERRNFPRRRFEPATIDELRREVTEQRLRLRARKAPNRKAYIGVYYQPQFGGVPWLALLTHKSAPPPSSSHYLGRYATAEEAARARDRATLYYLKRETPLNHPDEVDVLEAADAATLRADARRASKERRAARKA
jgi:hypothetical protein